MKNTMRVNNLAEQIEVKFEPGEPLTVSAAYNSINEMRQVAQCLTDAVGTDGITVDYDLDNKGFRWCIDRHMQYGPSQSLSFQYGQPTITGQKCSFDYDENGFLADPFKMLDGKGIDEAYGFDADGNKSYCLPVSVTHDQKSDKRFYEDITVRPYYHLNMSSPYLLYVVCWGGANEDTKGIDQELLSELYETVAPEKLFFSRSASKGGKQGIDYYVLPLDGGRYEAVREIVDMRLQQSKVTAEQKRQDYAKKLYLIKKINERLVEIVVTSVMPDADNLLNECKESAEAKAYYVDELRFDFGKDNDILMPPTLDYSLESLEARYLGLDDTERTYKRMAHDALNQVIRWKAASPRFEGFNQRMVGLGGTMTVNLYRIHADFPSCVDAGEYFTQKYTLGKVQLGMFSTTLLKYEQEADRTLE